MKPKLFLDSAVDKIEKKDILEKKKNKTCTTTHYIVTKENKKTLNHKEGDYVVMEFPYEHLHTKKNYLTKELERIIKFFLKKYENANKVLVVGLGNKSVDADALGYYVTEKLIATNHYHDFLTLPKIALFNPSVTDKTGINSFDLIKMVVENIKPNMIIMIDSLATNKEEYLNQAIEINDTGIIPGSVLNAAKEINQKTFNIPVLTIGVPCALLYNKKLYTSTFIHEVLSEASKVIADAINTIFIKHS